MNKFSNNTNTTDLLKELKKVKRMTIAQKMQFAQLQLDAERVELEKVKYQVEHAFWSKNFPSVLTAIVSITAILLTYAQFSQSTKQQEELRRLEVGKIILQHGDKLLSNERRQRELATQLILSPTTVDKPDEVLSYVQTITDTSTIELESLESNPKFKPTLPITNIIKKKRNVRVELNSHSTLDNGIQSDLLFLESVS